MLRPLTHAQLLCIVIVPLHLLLIVTMFFHLHRQFLLSVLFNSISIRMPSPLATDLHLFLFYTVINYRQGLFVVDRCWFASAQYFHTYRVVQVLLCQLFLRESVPCELRHQQPLPPPCCTQLFWDNVTYPGLKLIIKANGSNTDHEKSGVAAAFFALLLAFLLTQFGQANSHLTALTGKDSTFHICECAGLVWGKCRHQSVWG